RSSSSVAENERLPTYSRRPMCSSPFTGAVGATVPVGRAREAHTAHRAAGRRHRTNGREWAAPCFAEARFFSVDPHTTSAGSGANLSKRIARSRARAAPLQVARRGTFRYVAHAFLFLWLWDDGL